MTQPDSHNDPERVWQRLAAAARRAEDERSSPVDVDQVLRAVQSAPSPRDDESEQRLVSWAAAIAVAASLLVTVMSWSDVVAAWSPAPAPFELPIAVEPME